MKRVNVILETELYDKARVVGFIRKKSLSEIVREALRDWLNMNIDEGWTSSFLKRMNASS